MLSRISISSTRGAISIHTKGAQIKSDPDHYELIIRNNAAHSLSMQSTPVRVSIDQTASRTSIGRVSPYVSAMNSVQTALQRSIDNIGQIAMESQRFLRIEDGGNHFADEAFQSQFRNSDLSLTIASVDHPDISATPGTLQITAGVNGFSTNWTPISGNYEFVPHEVTISMAEYPSIEITVEPGVELHFPVSRGVGLHVDEAL